MDFIKKIGFLNLLLVFMPIAYILHWTHVNAVWVFLTSCIAIIPLAGLMGKSTEMIAHQVGPGLGGLLNASFGNAAELIIAIFALKKGMIGIVKASITGSILGNILLVLGASFFIGGLKYSRQKFNSTAAGLSATLLALAAIGLLVPAVFHAHLEIFHQTANESELSLEISIVLFTVYILMLLFSLKTHKHLYEMEAEGEDLNDELIEEVQHTKKEDWSIKTAVKVLIAATMGVVIISELLVGVIEETSEQMGWTEVFVGVIVIAIIGNAAEHSTAILMANKNRMELAFQIAVGSGLQIALFVAPLLVFISYLPGFPQRLDLVFSMLEVIAVVASVMVVGMVAFDGESNWMEGLLLLAVYLIMGIAFYNLPEMNSTPAHEPETSLLILKNVLHV